MQDHGLDAHKLDQRDGYFKVILPGSGGDFDRLRVSSEAQGLIPAFGKLLGPKGAKVP